MKDFSEVDVASLVPMEKGSRLHIVHGGVSDKYGTHQVLSHLQKSWVTAGIVYISTLKQLLDFADTYADRVPASTTLLLAVPLSVIAQAPDVVDTIARDVIMVSMIAASTLDAEARPYSARARVVVMTLPSVRVDGEASALAVAAVYRFPADPAQIVKAVDVMDHGMCLGWHAGGVSAVPSFVAVDTQAVVLSDKARDTQGFVDRAWWWNRETSHIPLVQCLPPDVHTVVQTSQLRASVVIPYPDIIQVLPDSGYIITAEKGYLATLPLSVHGITSQGDVVVLWLERIDFLTFRCLFLKPTSTVVPIQPPPTSWKITN
jgi:hypothetical protein